MSDVNANDSRLIDGPEDVLSLYIPGAGPDAKAGIETEICFFDPAAPDQAPMNVAQSKTVRDKANSVCGESCVRNEPSADMLEVSSFARGPEGLELVLRNMNDKIRFLSHTATETGLKRSYFQEQPAATAQQLFKNVMDVERYQAFFAPPRADMIDIATYFFVCKSNQVSVSYRDPEHMLANVRRLYYMAPFLFLLTDNSSAFNEGKIFPGHTGMHHRAALGTRGGVTPYVFTAKNGMGYIHAHIDNVMNNPLFVYYDEDGKMIRLPSGTWTSFNDLRAKGLNTATNYFFSQSVLWPDVKIASLKTKAGEVTSHRYEARMFGVGIHQHQTGFLITAGLAFFDDFAVKIDALLRRFGFSEDAPEESRILLEKSYAAARHHDGKFFNIAFGTGRMADFAKEFADLLEEGFTGRGMDDKLVPALTICRTGCTDGKINRALFPTLESALDFQKNYDPEIFENPNACAAMLFDVPGCEKRRATG